MNKSREYLKPGFSPFNMDRYVIRRAILQALQAELPNFSGSLLDVGCGYSPYRSILLSPPSHVSKYIALDLENNLYQKPELAWDGERIPLEDNSIDCAIATEILEHCFEPQKVLKEVCRVLKPEGLFFLTTPFLWPLHDTPWDFYRYTPFSLDKLMSQTGFKNINMKPLGGWNLAMAQILGLWVRRHPKSKIIKGISMLVFYPFWAALVLMSDRVSSGFVTNTIFCGLSTTAKKK
jgi:SAM-dependent methyltransferase